MIALHQPTTVDTASALSLLQEEELKISQKHIREREITKNRFRKFQLLDKNKYATSKKLKCKPITSEVENKLETLKAFHYKNGLCFRYGEKWGHSHTSSRFRFLACARRAL